jgi:hypothetical protein
MILRHLHHLEEDTKESIQRAQMERDSGAITDRQYEERFEAIMDNYRLSTASILEEKARADYRALFIDNPPT